MQTIPPVAVPSACHCSARHPLFVLGPRVWFGVGVCQLHPVLEFRHGAVDFDDVAYSKGRVGHPSAPCNGITSWIEAGVYVPLRLNQSQFTDAFLHELGHIVFRELTDNSHDEAAATLAGRLLHAMGVGNKWVAMMRTSAEPPTIIPGRSRQKKAKRTR